MLQRVLQIDDRMPLPVHFLQAILLLESLVVPGDGRSPGNRIFQRLQRDMCFPILVATECKTAACTMLQNVVDGMAGTILQAIQLGVDLHEPFVQVQWGQHQLNEPIHYGFS